MSALFRPGESVRPGEIARPVEYRSWTRRPVVPRPWTPQRVAGLDVDAELVRECRDQIVLHCRESDPFRDAVDELMVAGPVRVAAECGRLHEVEFGGMILALATTAEACDLALPRELLAMAERRADPDCPLRTVLAVLRREWRSKPDTDLTLPLLVGRALIEWCGICGWVDDGAVYIAG